MHYIWQYRLWRPQSMTTTDGRKLCIIDQGQLNTDAGPDFFNAKVTLDGQPWVGNIEMHVRASDWYRHGHDHDPAYNNVVLHVVQDDDMGVRTASGNLLPQLVMPCAADFSNRYNALVNNPAMALQCANSIASLPSIYLTDWLTALGYERLYAKVDRALDYLSRAQGDWATVVYVTLARALGFNTNSQPMERLAWRLPLRLLRKHSDNLGDLEAMLFGTAGLLDHFNLADPTLTPYVKRLCQDWHHFAAKFNLQAAPDLMWKMGRMRPTNFPHRRLATLARLLKDGFSLSANLLNADSEEQLRELFRVDLEGWWTRNFTFSPTDTGVAPRALSEASITVLLINVAAPLIYAYGLQYGRDDRQDFAVDLLHRLKPESNSIVALFTAAGIKCDDAFTSQALIQCRRNYCEPRKCLFCRIGHRILAMQSQP